MIKMSQFTMSSSSSREGFYDWPSGRTSAARRPAAQLDLRGRDLQRRADPGGGGTRRHISRRPRSARRTQGEDHALTQKFEQTLADARGVIDGKGIARLSNINP